MYCFSINIVCRLFVPSAFGFYQLYSRDRFTHGAQARRNRGGLGMAFDFEPWKLLLPILIHGQATRLLS